MKKNKEYYIDNIETEKAEDLFDAIRKDIISFDELQDTGVFEAKKQNEVRSLLADNSTESLTFKKLNSISDLKGFMLTFPKSSLIEEVKKKLNIFEKNAFESLSTLDNMNQFKSDFPESMKINSVDLMIKDLEAGEASAERNKMEQIKIDVLNNPNSKTPDELRILFKDNIDLLKEICSQLGVDYKLIRDYEEPSLAFSKIPKTKEEVPAGFTDIYFWGVPSSGKTCALATVFSTINKKYVMSNPKLDTQFGVAYRNNLKNIFTEDYGFLPSSTQTEQTQYIPFLLKKRDSKDYRKISFFELSGEVFKYIYELENDVELFSGSERLLVANGFRSVDLLLNSDNQKIHFFFIDYDRERKSKKDKHGLTQEDYLRTAATYFRDSNNILRKKTDAVYVIVTKADLIEGENPLKIAEDFLNDNFGGFLNELKVLCEKNSVEFSVKLFSIGEVFFDKISKIDHTYSSNIIEDLLKKINPEESDSLSSKVKRFFRG